MLHSAETALADGRFVCGDVELTVVSGTQSEKVQAVVSGGVVHYNLVRSYTGVTARGSDGQLYTVHASVHATVLLLEGSEEPISVREVVQATFGGLGYLHEVLVIDGADETSTVTGTCDYG